MKESAEKLYIHYNSIKYRYSKICKVLNLDLSDHDNRSLVEIAMKLYRLKHYKKGEPVKPDVYFMTGIRTSCHTEQQNSYFTFLFRITIAKRINPLNSHANIV